MKTIKALMVILLAACFSCQDETNPKFPDIRVAVNDTSEVAISDSIYYIITDTLPNKVTVVSEVSDATLSYAVNNAAITKRINAPIPLQEQDTVFQFYLSKKGYDDSKIKTISLQKHSKKFLDNVNVSTPVSDSNLSISMNDKSRGIVKIEIFTVTGQRLLHRNHMKNVDLFVIEYALAEYPRGMYVVSATYGKSQKGYRMIKE